MPGSLLLVRTVPSTPHDMLGGAVPLSPGSCLPWSLPSLEGFIGQNEVPAITSYQNGSRAKDPVYTGGSPGAPASVHLAPQKNGQTKYLMVVPTGVSAPAP